MHANWDMYLAARDLDEVQDAAYRMQQLALEHNNTEQAADMMMASRLYMIRGELEHGCVERALEGTRSLLGDMALIEDCSPAWHSRAHQLHGRVFYAYTDYAGAAMWFEHAARIREEAYKGSITVPYLYNQASASALKAGMEEWAVELALAALKHIEQYSWVLEDPEGRAHRVESVRCLNRALGLVSEAQPRRWWQRFSRKTA